MGIHDWLKKLETRATQDRISIPLRDGTVRTFSQDDLATAFVALCDGEDHPLLDVARASSDPWWSEGTYSTPPLRNVPDLSE